MNGNDDIAESAVNGKGPSESECRLTELEKRFCHLARFVDDLNEVIVGQEAKIEKLEREIARIKRVRAFQAGGQSGEDPGAGPSAEPMD